MMCADSYQPKSSVNMSPENASAYIDNIILSVYLFRHHFARIFYT